MLFFDVLLFTDDACVINGKTERKACKIDTTVFGLSRPQIFKETEHGRSCPFAAIGYGVLLFANDAL